jgi:hypothetical protein
MKDAREAAREWHRIGEHAPDDVKAASEMFRGLGVRDGPIASIALGVAAHSARIRGAWASGTARGSRGGANEKRAGQESGRDASKGRGAGAFDARVCAAGCEFCARFWGGSIGRRLAPAKSNLRTMDSTCVSHALIARRCARPNTTSAACANSSPACTILGAALSSMRVCRPPRPGIVLNRRCG